MKNRKTLIAALFVISMVTFAFHPVGKEPWLVPDKYVKMSNPVKSDPKSISSGKKLYIMNCEECHGKKGIGDGSKVPDLKTQPPDLTSPLSQKQSDGELFYKISEGKGEMPKAKKDLPDEEDRWNLVNYIRFLASKK